LNFEIVENIEKIAIFSGIEINKNSRAVVL